MVGLLDEILMSKNVVDRFYHEIKSNKDFGMWIEKNIPQLLDCERQQQNNPWHKYNVLCHILHSVEQINKQTLHLSQEERRVLAYTMLFHDIGKPVTHIVRKKDGKMIDSFFGHNKESVQIAKKILPILNFDEEQQKIILKLIDKHDIFMFIKDFPTSNQHWRILTEALVEEEIEDLSEVGDGVKLLKWLIMVGRADNLAQNETMTKESLALLNKFDRMVDERENEWNQNG